MKRKSEQPNNHALSIVTGSSLDFANKHGGGKSCYRRAARVQVKRRLAGRWVVGGLLHRVEVQLKSAEPAIGERDL